MLSRLSFFKLPALQPFTLQPCDYRYYWVCFIIACIYSSILISLPVDSSILDRVNYINYAENSDVIFARFYSGGLLSLLFNEPVWLLVNMGLNTFLTPESVVRCIILISSFSVSYYIVRVNQKAFLFLLLLLIFPQVAGKFIVHLRQGFAIAIFIIALMTKKDYLRFLLVISTPFIHSSFFILVLFAVIGSILQNSRLAEDVKSFAMAFISLTVGSSLIIIGSFLGARQATGEAITIVTSGFGLVFWLSILLLYYAAGKAFVQKYIFALACIIFYLATYFVSAYTARVFESAFILTVIVALNLSPMRRLFAYGMFMFLLVLGYYTRLGKPLLGFGVL
ncbi:hypothetical protein N473_05745 [Pseudoalteromonas luteoviolacea CPMOR-1]|uniref:EpsG family protein n=2 Tax=Pseudoalteromonas luteoviolacea TaxID=43657 RepID=A0A161YDS4_9GAMM|nr:hypothetical protein N473_05745 [Pseudoalteromonas luteoviolacea CPMOR-1]